LNTIVYAQIFWNDKDLRERNSNIPALLVLRNTKKNRADGLQATLKAEAGIRIIGKALNKGTQFEKVSKAARTTSRSNKAFSSYHA